MPAPHGGPSLPNDLLKQLGVGPSATGGGSKKGKPGFHTRSQGRKDRRKEERQAKKGHNGAGRPTAKSNQPSREPTGGAKTRPSKSPNQARERPGPKVAPRVEEEDTFNGFDSDDSVDEDDLGDLNGLEVDEEEEDGEEEEQQAPSARMSKAERERMAKDDAEIARLEKKLGMKGKKGLPKSFDEDGLGDLLGELDGDSGSEEDPGKRKRKSVDDEWLAQKRRKLAAASRTAPAAKDDDEDSLDSDMSGDDLLDELMDSDDMDDMDGMGDMDGESNNQLDDSDNDAGSGHQDDSSEIPRQRENPYVPPVTASTSKYIPPSRREPAGSDAEAAKLTQRKAQGLVNRLTEANLIAILGDIEKLYQDSPRQYATDAIVNTFMAQLTDRSSLQGTMLILYAGFATAVYKVIGSDFGAHLVQRTVDEFKTHYGQAKAQSGEQQAILKQPSNLMVFMTQLYMFRMIGSNLIFDCVRMLLSELSELNAELLLQILRNAGQRLRSEDPLALKDILGLIRPAVERAGGKDNTSVRTQFMIETMYDLKNNKTKSRTNATNAQNLDHATRLNKALGTLNIRRLKATEPLRVSLDDLEQSSKRGKWWLVGASWAGTGTDTTKEDERTPKDSHASVEDEPLPDIDVDADYFPGLPDLKKLNELAKAEGMNTDARYAIFRSLLVSADSQEAYLRLQRLRLNKIERREIPGVIIQCSGSEIKYNPFYTEVAKKVCSDHKVQWGFQDALWKLFKRVGETLFDQDDGDDDAGDDEDLCEERLTNVGLMFGTLVANGVLGIRILKCLNFAMLRPKTQAAVQAIIIGLLRAKIRLGKGKGNKAAIKEPFLAVESPEFARGLRYFLKKVVRKTKDVKRGKGLSEALALAEEALKEVEARESEQ